MKWSPAVAVFGILLLLSGAVATYKFVNLDCEIEKTETIDGPTGEENITRTIDGGPLRCSTTNFQNMALSVLGPGLMFIGMSTLAGSIKMFLKGL